MESEEACTFPFFRQIYIQDRHCISKLKILHSVWFRIHDPNYKSQFMLRFSTALLLLSGPTMRLHVSISSSFPSFCNNTVHC